MTQNCAKFDCKHKTLTEQTFLSNMFQFIWNVKNKYSQQQKYFKYAVSKYDEDNNNNNNRKLIGNKNLPVPVSYTHLDVYKRQYVSK